MKKTIRPKVRPQRTAIDFICESIAIGAIIYGLILVLQHWSRLPNSIPIHFDASGVADGWGPKGMIWLLPAISVVMIPSMLIFRRFPWLLNTPVKITEENAEYQYGLFVRLLNVLACVVSLLFLALLNDTISIAGGGESLLGSWFMPIFIVPIVVTLLWYFVSAMRRR